MGHTPQEPKQILYEQSFPSHGFDLNDYFIWTPRIKKYYLESENPTPYTQLACA